MLLKPHNKPLEHLTVSAIQMSAGPKKEKNLANARRLVDQALRNLARVVVLPEGFLMRAPHKDLIAEAETLDGPAIKALQADAKKFCAWLVLGGVLLKPKAKAKGKDKVENTLILIGPDGEIKATYVKMHLFQSLVPNAKVSEVDFCIPGKKPLMVDIHGFKVGFSICYDLRFPDLYQHYAKEGADLLIIPAAFTFETGRHHWHTLVKARAIETQCFVLAANQSGQGANRVMAYGHSLILDPWGLTLSEAGPQTKTIISATLEKQRLQEVRNQIPMQRV
ncbi:MAG: putative amidohydrolase [Candidatus Omnitrophota bacterium]|jgi:predicted amidohydrolase